MTIESAKAFLEKVQNDADLRTKLSDKNLSGEDRLNIAKSEGFEFTSQEMVNVREELSDEMLESISGGADECMHSAEFSSGVNHCAFLEPPQLN